MPLPQWVRCVLLLLLVLLLADASTDVVNVSGALDIHDFKYHEKMQVNINEDNIPVVARDNEYMTGLVMKRDVERE